MRIQKVCRGYSFWWGDGKIINKSISLNWYWEWINKPWAWFRCSSNGAKKGIDNCYDFNFHLFLFAFSYTDWNYGRFIARLHPSELKVLKEATLEKEVFNEARNERQTEVIRQGSLGSS